MSFLYTTGLHARHLILALRNYRYLFSLPANRLVHAALRELQSMWLDGKDCWLKDVVKIIEHTAPEWPAIGESMTSLEGVDEMIAGIEKWSWNEVLTDLHNSKKLSILQTRYPRPPLVNKPSTIFHLQSYLLVPTPAHRKSLCCLVTSCHHLAVETLRWGSYDSRKNRLCRFCKLKVEDELHTVFECEHYTEVSLRAEIKPRIALTVDGSRGMGILNEAMDDPGLRAVLASFVHNVLAIYDSTPMYRAPQYIPGSTNTEDDTFTIPEEDDQVEQLYV
ncbi:hypothetical protein AAF712_016179 [Marasmius tenuissimus]|uniref:Uncharacterized protein n=1 Tax=Marasmius tenuissimus TaxID=585030 RepID=A0ABR2Z7F3_9AGAR